MYELISIILPVYNCETFLKRTLDALKVQTYPDIEILCINDGSTDGSQEILEKYASDDPRFRIFTQCNSGAGRARNVGLNNMRGKYVTFCDSDDCYDSTMCEKMLEAIQGTNADFVECGMKLYIDCATDHAKNTINYINHHRENKLIWLDNITSRYIAPFVMNKIFRSEKILKHHIKFPDFHYSEDDAFITQYMAQSNFYFTMMDRLYIYTIRKNSQMYMIFSGSNDDNILKNNSLALDVLKSMAYAVTSIKNQNRLDKISEALLWKISYCTNIVIAWGYKDYNHIFDILYNILINFDTKKIKIFPLFYLIRKKQYLLAKMVLKNSYPIRVAKRVKRLGKWCKHFVNKYILLYDC